MATVQQLVDATSAQAVAASELNELVTSRVVPALEGIGDRIDPALLDPVLSAINASTESINAAAENLTAALPPQ